MADASAGMSRMFQQRFAPGTTVNVPMGMDATAAKMAGLRVVYQPAGLWPYPGLLNLPSMARPAAWEDIQWHNHIRDLFADSVRAAPNGQAIVEVTMTAKSGARADADIVARGPRGMPGVTPQAFFEIKTGKSSEIRPNQQYVYALAITGGHVMSWHPQLPISFY